jgi:hypothetical protein
MLRFFLILFFLYSNSYAVGDFTVVEHPSLGTKVYVISLENEKYLWSSALYIRNAEAGKSNLYKKAGYPDVKLPSIHAYNPDTQRLVAIELPFGGFSQFPEDVQKATQERYVDILKMFISIERADSQQLLFRPHRFVIRDTPSYSADSSRYASNVKVVTSVYDINGKKIDYTDAGQLGAMPIDGSVSYTSTISSHSNLPNDPGAPATATTSFRPRHVLEYIPDDQHYANLGDNVYDIVASPSNMVLPLDKAIPGRSQGFYSYVYHQDASNPPLRGFYKDKAEIAAVTYHWLLSDADANAMENLLAGARDFPHFVQLLIEHPSFNGKPELQAFLALLP